MSTFTLKEIKIAGAKHKFYSLVKDNVNFYDQFLDEVKENFHIPLDEELRLENDEDELSELEALIEDIALGNPVLPKCYKKMPSISKQINYTAHEIRTKKSMLRIYCIKERNTGKIIVLGHIKGNSKDQDRKLKIFKKRVNEYHNFKLKNKK